MNWPIIVSPKITDLETTDLSQAYSALKDSHLDLKRRYHHMRDVNKDLRTELEDYKERYDHLIKYLNNKDD